MSTDRDRIEELEEENRQLRDLLFAESDGAFVTACQQKLKLRRSAARVLRAIVHRRRISYDALYAMNYADAIDPPSEKMVQVHAFEIRKRLRPFGITIGTIRGVGYDIDADNRDRLIDLLGCDVEPKRVAA